MKFEIPSKHDTASNFCFISSNIITGKYGLNKTTLVLIVAFLLSVSIGSEKTLSHWFNF